MKILKVTLAMLLAVVMLFSLCACSFNIPGLDDLDPNNIIVDDTQKDKDDKNRNPVNLMKQQLILKDVKL